MSVAETNGTTTPVMTMDQVTSTIYTALNPATAGKEKSLEADRLLKSHSSSLSLWPQIMQVLSRLGAVEDQVIFYCLSLLEHYSNVHGETKFREPFTKVTLEWLASGSYPKMANFLKNKTAQIWCRLLVEEYATTRWPSAFQEMCSWWMMTAEHADLFLRVCLAVNEEVSRDILDDRKESPKVAAVKDKLREADVGQLVQVWRLLITDRSQKALVRMALRCIAGYAPWIDVNLTANPDLLQHIYGCLETADYGSLAIDCLTAIVGKGMAVTEKLKLIVYLNLNSVYLGALRMKEENEEFFEKACRLLNVSGYTLTSSFDDQVATYLCQQLIPTLTQYLMATESMECLLDLAPFSGQVVEYFKGRPLVMNAEQVLLDLFKAVVKVITYPPVFDFDAPGEEEELFPELRQKYMHAFDQSVMLLGSSATEVMMPKMRISADVNADLKEQELGIYLCFRYCDAHRGYSFMSNIGGQQKVTMFGQILCDLFSRQFSPNVPFLFSTFLDCAGRIAQTPFFELFATSFQSCLMTVISGLPVIVGMDDPDLSRKAFSCFNKLVKSQKSIPFAGQLLSACSSLVTGCLSNDQSDFYEAIGYLSGLVKDVSLLSFFESSLENGGIQLQVIKSCGAYLKGLSESNTTKQSPMIVDIERIAKISDCSAQILTANPTAASFECCKYFCQRTIGMIRGRGQPLLMQLLVFSFESNDELVLSSTLQVLSASVFKLKGEILPLLSQIWVPLGNKITSLLSCQPAMVNNTATVNHAVLELKRQAMALLIALFSSNLAGDVIPINFDPYMTACMATFEEADFALKRSAMSVFTRLIALPVIVDSVSQTLFSIVIPSAFQALRLITRDTCHEANHQAFVAEFCNLLSTLSRHDRYGPSAINMVRSSVGQPSLPTEAITDQRALKTLFIGMLENQ